MNNLIRSIGASVAVAGLLVLAAPQAWAAPANDNYANATDLGSAGMIAVSGDNSDASREPDEYPGQRTVWFRWTAPVTGSVTYTTCDTDFDNVVIWFADTGAAMPQESDLVFYSDDDNPNCGRAPAFGGSTRTLSVTEGTTYSIRVSGFGSAFGSFVLNLSVSETPADNSPPPMYEAVGKTGDCDVANGWAESWQQWAADGAGGAVCERTLVYWTSWNAWVVVRFDVTEGRYVPVWGAKGIPGAGSGEQPGVKSGS